MLVPEGRIPWTGHTGLHAAREVYKLIAAHKLTIVFVNTRAVAELTFRDLWNVNDDALPIGIHHGSLAPEARRKTEAAMSAGKLRAIVATASLDLGLDWGDVDLVVQMGAPKGSSRLLQRIGRANHRMDEPSKAVIVPGNRFEYLEAVAAVDAVAEHELDEDVFRPGSLDVLAQHLMGVACAAPFAPDMMYEEIRSSSPYAGLPRETFVFLRDLAAHNDREWFEAHRAEYEAHWLTAGLDLIAALGPLGFWPEHVSDQWSVQIWFDLLCAIGTAWALLAPRARAVELSPWPWLVLIAATGSIGLLAMLARVLHRESAAGRTAPA